MSGTSASPAQTKRMVPRRSNMSEITSAQERSILERIFLSPDAPRLRAGWRLLIQTILFFLFGIIIAAVALALGLDIGSLIFGNVLNFIAVTGSVYIARRW